MKKKVIFTAAFLVIKLISYGQISIDHIDSAFIRLFNMKYTYKRYIFANGKIDEKVKNFLLPFIKELKAEQTINFRSKAEIYKNTFEYSDIIMYEYSSDHAAAKMFGEVKQKQKTVDESFGPLGKDYNFGCLIQNYIIRLNGQCGLDKSRWEERKKQIVSVVTQIFKPVYIKSKMEAICGGGLVH